MPDDPDGAGWLVESLFNLLNCAIDFLTIFLQQVKTMLKEPLVKFIVAFYRDVFGSRNRL